MSLEITIIAGRRPDLLKKTLNSFANGLFDECKIDGVIVNIDPIFGDEESHEKCREIIFNFFPSAIVFEPDKASFCGAVKRLWGSTSADLVFHLEDDWVLMERVDNDRARRWIESVVGRDARTKAVSLLSANHGGKGRGEFSELLVARRVFGCFDCRQRVSAFNTSPGFFSGKFIRHVSGFLDLNVDPEKQMRSPLNPPLNSYLRQYRCRFLKSAEDGAIIQDIGRDWLRARGIEKVTSEGVASWREMFQPGAC